MNRSELVGEVSRVTELSKAQANQALEAIIMQIRKALKKGDKVMLVGFGSFAVRRRAARVGRNPHTGESIKIKARKAPVFKAGASLRAAL